MKRRFLVPGHPEKVIQADHMYCSNNGMLWFINGDLESFMYSDSLDQDDCYYSIVAQFQGGVLILPVEEAS